MSGFAYYNPDVINEMPLYVQNETEVLNEDDSPLRANTPSTGSMYDYSRISKGGDRVLELMEKHKKEVQTRMAHSEHGFRAMLEKSRGQESSQNRRVSVGESNRRGSPNEMPSASPRRNGPAAVDKLRIAELYKDAIYNTDKTGHKAAAPHAVKVKLASSPGNRGRPSPPNVESEEYFDVPSFNVETQPANYQRSPPSPKSHNARGHHHHHHHTTTRNDDPRVSPQTNAVSVNKPQSPEPRADRSFLEDYEPDAGTETDECCSDKEGKNELNNNRRVSPFETKVQFQLPHAIPIQEGRYMMMTTTDDDSDSDINGPDHNVAKRETVKSHTSIASTEVTSSSKHKSVKQKSSTKHVYKSTATFSEEGESDSDHEYLSASGSETATSTPSTWEQICDFFGGHCWTLVILGGALILFFGLYIVSRSASSGSGSDDAGSSFEPKSYEIKYVDGPVM